MSQPNYHTYLALEWVSRFAESRFLGGKKLRFPRLVMAYYVLFQTGAVLGRSMSTRADAHFAELFAEPGRGADLAPWFRETGKSLAAECQSSNENTLFELAMRQLVEGGVEEIFRLRDKWVPVADAVTTLQGRAWRLARRYGS